MQEVSQKVLERILRGKLDERGMVMVRKADIFIDERMVGMAEEPSLLAYMDEERIADILRVATTAMLDVYRNDPARGIESDRTISRVATLMYRLSGAIAVGALHRERINRREEESKWKNLDQ